MQQNSYAQAKYRLPKQYDIRLSIAKTISEANTIFPVYDQGNLGSCTANAAAGALQLKRILEKLPNYVPSRLMIYYNERANDQTLSVNQDTGATIADSIANIIKYGACNETLWPYSDVTTGTQPEPLFTQKPTTACYTAALSDMALHMLIFQMLKLQWILTH